MKGTGFWAMAGVARAVKTVRTAMKKRTEVERMRIVRLRWLVMGDLLQVNRLQGS
jgi:hypothetical protein